MEIMISDNCGYLGNLRDSQAKHRPPPKDLIHSAFIRSGAFLAAA